MLTLAAAHRTLASVDLVEGLSPKEVEQRLRVGTRLGDTGQRIHAFYLADMAARELHQEFGFNTTTRYAEERLGLSARRARELIAVGRKLLELPAIDAAFCTHEIGWAKVLELAKVAGSKHEQRWLDLARKVTCRELRRAVLCSEEDGPPREPGDRRALRPVRFGVHARVDLLTHQLLQRAKEKLGAERGGPVGDGECLRALAEIFLNSEDDGTLPGRTRVDASLYRIVLHRDVSAGGESAGDLEVDTDLGRLPVEHGDVVACDALVGGSVDGKTSAALRRRILDRDGHRCRCCGGRQELHVHHIVFRENGGPTRAFNLITICIRCHELVHEGLLVLSGKDERKVRFLDARGEPLHEVGQPLPAAVLPALSRPAPVVPAEEETDLVVFEDVPEAVDGAWWARHAHLFQTRGGSGLTFTSGAPRVVPVAGEGGAANVRRPTEGHFFRGLLGRRELAQRLERRAKGARKRERTFPHTLFTGAHPTEAPVLAQGVADLCGVPLRRIRGTDVAGAGGLVEGLATLQAGDVVFLEGVESLPKASLALVSEAVTQGHVQLVLRAGGRTRTVRLDLPPFTLIVAPVEARALPKAFRAGFPQRESAGACPLHEVSALLSQRAEAEGVALSLRGGWSLVNAAEWSVVEAVRLLDAVLDEAAAEDRTRLDRGFVQRSLGLDDSETEGPAWRSPSPGGQHQGSFAAPHRQSSLGDAVPYPSQS